MKKIFLFLILITISTLTASAETPDLSIKQVQEVVDRSSGAIVHLEGLCADGQTITGTGFFITSDGVLITNRHMIESVPDRSLIAYDIFGERLGLAELEADTLDAEDLAVMKVTMKKRVAYLRAHKWCSAHGGDNIVILGFPSNQLQISKGNIGGFTEVEDNSRGKQKTVMEVRADVTYGSSGSPVLDADANVVGVITGTIIGPNALGQQVEVVYAEPIESAAEMVKAVLNKIHPKR